MVNDDFYVYAYLDPRKCGNYSYLDYTFDYEPFYIGKGKSDRMYAHLDEAKNLNISSYKVSKIRKIIQSGHTPIVIKVVDNLGEFYAFQIERDLIAEIGFSRGSKFGEKVGPLTNSMPGGSAPPKPIAGEFHTAKASADGTHWWLNGTHVQEYTKWRYENGVPHFSQILSKEGTHYWYGSGNPIHKRIASGSILGQNHHANKRECQLNCEKEFLNRNEPYRIELTEQLALKLGFKKRQNLYCSIRHKIKLNKICGTFIEEHIFSVKKRKYYVVNTGNMESFFENDKHWITIDHRT